MVLDNILCALSLCLSYLFLNIYFLKLLLPCIEEDELHVQLGPEHEHILVQLDFCDGRWRQRVTDGHQAEILDEAALSIPAIGIDASLQITGAVYHL